MQSDAPFCTNQIPLNLFFAEDEDCKIYFSTDGTKPNPFQLKSGGRETTFKYRGPFTLKNGKRTLKVVAVSRWLFETHSGVKCRSVCFNLSACEAILQYDLDIWYMIYVITGVYIFISEHMEVQSYESITCFVNYKGPDSLIWKEKQMHRFEITAFIQCDLRAHFLFRPELYGFFCHAFPWHHHLYVGSSVFLFNIKIFVCSISGMAFTKAMSWPKHSMWMTQGPQIVTLKVFLENQMMIQLIYFLMKRQKGLTQENQWLAVLAKRKYVFEVILHWVLQDIKMLCTKNVCINHITWTYIVTTYIAWTFYIRALKLFHIIKLQRGSRLSTKVCLWMIIQYVWFHSHVS